MTGEPAYRNAYFEIQKMLDEMLGAHERDGEGIVADLYLALEKAEQRGAAKALRIEAMRGLEAAEKAQARVSPFTDFAVQLMKGIAQELARRADAIESGEVRL